MSQFHKLTIKSIKRETSKAVSLLFEVPEYLADTYTFKAGQYITLRAFIKDQEIRRDYSICTTPESKLLKVVVKEVEGGVFSVFANQNLKEGDSLEVAPPNGRFIFVPDAAKSRTIMAFAAGSGITPVMGIVKTVLELEPNSKMVLTYGNKTPEDTIFLKDLISLKEQFGNRFLLKFVFSQTTHNDALYGRIERPAIKYMLNQIEDKTNIDAFYLCGPAAMITTISDLLIDEGYSKDKVHFELFTPAEQPDAPIAQKTDGQTKVTVTVDDEELQFNMPKTKTVLESALEHDVDAPYSCQGGICSSCIAKLTQGEVKMRQNNILTDGEIAQGLILTCQAEPITDEISVDYDDV